MSRGHPARTCVLKRACPGSLPRESTGRSSRNTSRLCQTEQAKSNMKLVREREKRESALIIVDIFSRLGIQK